jgi:hypothetical protein
MYTPFGLLGKSEKIKKMRGTVAIVGEQPSSVAL